jgi:hypothetical protein
MYAEGQVADILRMEDFARLATTSSRQWRFVRNDETDLEMALERHFQGDSHQRNVAAHEVLRNL